MFVGTGPTLAQGSCLRSSPFRLSSIMLNRTTHKAVAAPSSRASRLAAPNTVLPSHCEGLFSCTGAERPHVELQVIEVESLSFVPRTTLEEFKAALQLTDYSRF